MKKQLANADNPLRYTLSLLIDKWSLLIIRDILLNGMTGCSEFFYAEEKIASASLQSRLAELTEDGLLTRTGAESGKTKVSYALTDKATNLLPVVFEVMSWGILYPEGEKCTDINNRHHADHDLRVSAFIEKIVAERDGIYRE